MVVQLIHQIEGDFVMVLAQQIVLYLVGLLAASTTLVVWRYSPQIKKIIDAHLTAKEANIANGLIDGLGTIAENVVGGFNARVVNDLKAGGRFDATAQSIVKHDAIEAVKSQAATTLKLGQTTLAQMEGMISDMIDTAVENAKAKGGVPANATKTPSATAMTPAPTTPAAS